MNSILSRARVGEAQEIVDAHRSQAEALMDDPEAAVGVAWFSEAAGRAAFRSATHADAVAWSDRALRLAEPLRLDEVVAMSLITKSLGLIYLGRYREGIALQVGAYADAGARGLRVPQLRAGVNLAAHSMDTDPRAAVTYTLDGIEAARRLGLATFAYYHAGNLATPAWRLGEWDMALRVLAQLEETALDEATRAVIADSRSQLLAWRGSDPGDRPARRIAAAEEAKDPQELLNGNASALEQAFLRGDLAAAVGFGRAILADGLDFGGPNQRFWIGRVALHAGDDALAERVLTKIEPGVGGAADGDIACLRAGLAARRGDIDAALTGYRAASTVYRDLGLRFDVAMAGLDMAVLLDRAEPAVAAAAAEARAIFIDLGAAPLVERLERLVPVSAVSG